MMWLICILNDNVTLLKMKEVYVFLSETGFPKHINRYMANMKIYFGSTKCGKRTTCLTSSFR